MVRLRWSLCPVIATLAWACEALAVGPDVVVRTQAAQYVPDADGRVRVSFELSNQGDETAFVMSCGLNGGGDRFVWDVDQLQGDTWIVRAERTVHVCPGSAPDLELGPGASYDGTVTLLGDAGTYRLRTYYRGPSGGGEVRRTGPSDPFEILAAP